MFGQLGWGELMIVVLVGLFVFGPDRLPQVIRDVGKVLRQVRSAAKGVREDIRSELGPEVADLDLRSLHPRAFIEKHLLSDDDEDEYDAPPVRVPTSDVADPAPADRLTKRTPSAATPYDSDAT